VTGAAGGRDGDDWQASYLSPAHTKLKRGPLPDAVAAHERQVAAVRTKFNGVLPFYRVWQLRVEERNAAPPVMGRGTPSRPHQQLLQRELSATKRFLRDYGRRRGLAPASGPGGASPVSETSVEVHLLLRAASAPRSLYPDRVLERRQPISKSPPGRSLLAAGS
jgi:hypothetical protein